MRLLITLIRLEGLAPQTTTTHKLCVFLNFKFITNKKCFRVSWNTVVSRSFMQKQIKTTPHPKLQNTKGVRQLFVCLLPRTRPGNPEAMGSHLGMTPLHLCLPKTIITLQTLSVNTVTFWDGYLRI